MIVVSVRAPEDLMRAKAFAEAASDRHPVLVLCHGSELCDRARERGLSVSEDPWQLLLDAQRVAAFVSLRASSADRCYAELALVSAFDELGIPTIALQRSLFQAGFEPRLGKSLVLSGAAPTAVAPDTIACAARHALGLSEPSQARGALRADVAGAVLVCTDLHAPDYDELERHQLLLALIALCTAMPDQRFVWRPHPAEAGHPAALALAQLVHGFELPNLAIEHALYAEELAQAGPRAAVCTLGTPLLALERAGVPCLVYASRARAVLRAGIAGRFVDAPSELPTLLGELWGEPDAFVPRLGRATPDSARFHGELERVLATRALVPQHVPRALEHVRRLRAEPASVVPAAPVSLGPVLFELRRVFEKLGVVQRSTLAYKAKRLARRIRP